MRLRLCLICLVLLGCRTVPQVPSLDLSQPGWQARQGQAVWKPNRNAAELAGELVWAAHPDGRFLLQFLKTPITLVEARGSEEAWEISFPPQGRTISGRRARRLGWLHLAWALQGKSVASAWTFARTDEKWQLANERTGEMIEGYLRP